MWSSVTDGALCQLSNVKNYDNMINTNVKGFNYNQHHKYPSSVRFILKSLTFILASTVPSNLHRSISIFNEILYCSGRSLQLTVAFSPTKSPIKDHREQTSHRQHRPVWNPHLELLPSNNKVYLINHFHAH